MSAGRKVTVTLTQAEASALVRAYSALEDAICAHPDWPALERAVTKTQHQLNAVRGKVNA
jgi:hypothetical protein